MTLVSRASYMQHGMGAAQKRPFSSQLIFPPTFWHTVSQMGRKKARSGALRRSGTLPEARHTILRLCRMTTSPRGTEKINGDDEPPTSLRVVHALAFLFFHSTMCARHTCIQIATAHASAIRKFSQQQRKRPVRAPSSLAFHSAPENTVVCIVFLLRLRGPRASWKKAVTTISHRALFCAR
jgi:hypothetical protein